MKKPSLPISLWFIFHIGLTLALLLSIFMGFSPPSVDTDLLGLVPFSSNKQDMAEAERILNQRHIRDFVILTGSEDYFTAKEKACDLYRKLDQHLAGAPALFEDLSFFIDENAIIDFSDYLHEYRYALLDPQSLDLLENGEAETLANESLAWAYGAFNFTGLNYLDEDPFLLSERELRYFFESSFLISGLNLRDGILSGEFENIYYILLRGRLSEAGASISKGSGIREIYRITEEIAKDDSTVNFVFSGVPFHSYESSTKAQQEITLISSVTMLLLLLLFFWVFRSALPALAIIFAAVVSILAGLCAVFLVFRTIHILTFNFGASLIGLSVDYSIHFFVYRRSLMRDGSIDSPLKTVRHSLFKGVTLSFISSFICFLIFLFAPYGILRQFALFSAIGLLSSYITVICLFPDGTLFSLKPAGRNVPEKRRQKQGKTISLTVKRALLAGLSIAFISIIFVKQYTVTSQQSPLRIKNDLRSLYPVPPKLFEWERIASSLLNYSSGNSFFISGSGLQELLEHEEIFLNRLNETGLGTFLGVSLFMPSIKTQEARYRSAAALLPLAEAQYEALGFPPEKAQVLKEDYVDMAEHYVLPSAVPPMAAELLSGLLIGRTGEDSGKERWYSVIMPFGAAKTNADSYDIKKQVLLANQYEWAAVRNTAEDISADMDNLTGTMIRLLCIAYGIIVLGMIFYYRNVLQIFKIAIIPVFAAIVNLAVLALSGLSFSFFNITGFILVLGLGLDYMFYLCENVAAGKNTRREIYQKAGTVKLAVVLSYVTTAISFGALVFSSFVPVHLLALSVFPGLSASFVWAMLVND
jgi:predicted exporter